MDDLKIFAESREDLRKASEEAEEVSNALGMQFGLSKCAVAHVRAGRLAAGQSLKLQSGNTIPSVQYGETYRYLGIAQLFGVNLRQTKEKIRKEYLGRICKVWGGNTNSRTRARNHNTWCVGLFRYFFGAVLWTRLELIQLDRKTRNVMAQNKCHHRGAAVERLYLPRAKGGRGLQNLLQTWEREVVSATAYLCQSEDPQVQAAMKSQEEMEAIGRYSYLSQATQILTQYGCDTSLEQSRPRTCSGEVRDRQGEEQTEKLLKKTIHGVHARQTMESGTDSKATNQWLVEGRLQPTTEAIIVAAQDGVTYTRTEHGYCNTRLTPTAGGAEKAQKLWGTFYPPAGRSNFRSSRPGMIRYYAV